MPEKVNVFIEYLASLYGSDPYWNNGLDLAALVSGKAAKKSGSTARRAPAAPKAGELDEAALPAR